MAKGVLCLAFCIIASVFCRSTQQTKDIQYCKLNNCSALCFESHPNNVLKPCLECTKEEADTEMFNERCKDRVKKVSWQRQLWCDGDNHSFPRCPYIPVELEAQCQNTESRHRMVCGDICTFLCRGVEVTVTCTEQLAWNDTIPNATQCALETSGPLPIPAETTSVTTVIVGSIVPCVAVLAIVFFSLFIAYRRLNRTTVLKVDYISGTGSSQDATCLIKQTPSSSGSPETEAKEEHLCDAHGAQPRSMKVLDTAGEALVPSRQVDTKPSQLSLSRLELQMSSPLTATAELSTEEKPFPSKSHKILGDLLEDMHLAKRLSELFDQHDRFDKVTWHLIALHLLQWPNDKITNLEYHCRSSTPDLGDSPTYRVLKTLMHKGKGINELVDFLQHHESCHKADNAWAALCLLQTFEEQWCNKH